ncbi:MAG: GNAT family N-acetyltransferase [Anaerolineales bacterium]|nr:GNAT family N-acetyltransferase [Anaerolineales bacterium]
MNPLPLTQDLPRLAGFAFRPYRGEADLPAMLAVLRAAKDADGLEDVDTLTTMQNQYRHLTNCDPDRDIVLVEGPDGLAAYGRTLWFKEDRPADNREIYHHVVVGFVQPALRGQGVGRALHAWLEARAQAVAAELGHAARPAAEVDWQSFAYEQETAKGRLLTRAGYQPIRYFYDMVRPNLDDIPDARLPAGLEVRPALPEHYRAIWEANEEAFRDHWAEPERTPEDYERWLHDEREFQPEIWKVAWDTAGNQVAGMVLGYILAEQNEKFNRRRGWTENICVRRPWRKQGVASALIAENLRELKARGMTEAALGVDTENPTGALGVYERMGFRPVRREAAYAKPFPRHA